MSDSDSRDRIVDVPATGAAAFVLALAQTMAAAQVVTLRLDAVPVIDSPLMSAAIVLLRAVREHGGTVRLAVSRPPLIAQLRVAALDRVFDVVPPEASLAHAPRRARRSLGLDRTRPAALAGAMVAAVLAIAAPGSSSAQGFGDAEAIVARVAAQNPSLGTYQAHIDVFVRLKTFPYLGERLTGTTYYKRPNNFEVVFDSVPSYARGFERLYTDVGDAASWHVRFNLSLAGIREYAGRSDLVIRLVLKNRGNIDYEEVLVDPAEWRVDRMEWHYYNGGLISMTQDFTREGAYALLAAQHLTIRIPHISALAESRFSHYRTNISIADGLFTRAPQ